MTDEPAVLTSDALVDTSLGLTAYGMRDLAVIAQLAAIRQAPNNARAHVALAESLLRRGEYLPGFREHEWRAQLDPGYQKWPHLDSAQWCGMRLPERARLLVVADQGFGDTLMFSRYLPWARDRCDFLDFGVDPAMAPLFTGLTCLSSVFSEWKDAPGHAAHVRLSSLPMLAGTMLQTIPRPISLATPDLPEVWRGAFKGGKAPRIGLAWRGREETAEQKERSVPAGLLYGLTLGFGAKARFVVLQRDLRPGEWPEAPPEGRLEALTDWSHTAAVISHLDLVITSDTAIAHLAGTIGTPCWVMLKHTADWRWGIDCRDSPWYPGLTRLFRQTIPGQWAAVMKDMRGALLEFCG